VLTGHRVEAARQLLHENAQPGPVEGLPQLEVARSGLGEQQVLPDGRIEYMALLRQQPDH
jgi:hypothetical protein